MSELFEQLRHVLADRYDVTRELGAGEALRKLPVYEETMRLVNWPTRIYRYQE